MHSTMVPIGNIVNRTSKAQIAMALNIEVFSWRVLGFVGHLGTSYMLRGRGGSTDRDGLGGAKDVLIGRLVAGTTSSSLEDSESGWPGLGDLTGSSLEISDSNGCSSGVLVARRETGVLECVA